MFYDVLHNQEKNTRCGGTWHPHVMTDATDVGEIKIEEKNMIAKI